MRPEPPMGHQVADVAWVGQVKRGLLGNEGGTGKTRSALDATIGMKTLIVGPSLVLESGNWDDNIDDWAIDPGNYTQASYHLLNARKPGPRGGQVPIMALRPEYKGHWDALIVDEAHYTKGRKTSWTWAVEEIAKNSDLVMEMTGTPIPNWAHELYTVLRVVFPEEAGRGQRFGSFWRWAEKWFDTSPTRHSKGNPVVGEMLACLPSCLERPPTDPCEHYHRFMRENFGGHFRRVLRTDVLDLPPVSEQVVRMHLSATDQRFYRQMAKDFATTIDDTEILAWSQGAKNVALDKITVSPWLLSRQGPPRGGKLDLLRFDLEARTRPTLVLAHYQDVVEACAAISESVGARTAYVHGNNKPNAGAIVRDFKAGRLDVLVGSLELVAEGLQLTQADMCIFVEKSFKPSRNEQAWWRVHRMGQERPVTIRDYVVMGTIDEKKRQLLATKTDRQMRFMSAGDFKRML